MANKLLSVLLFSFLLFPLFLLPAAAAATTDSGCPYTINYASSYLQATNITATSVTLTAQFCVTFQGELIPLEAAGSPGTGVFQLGTTPGVYTQRIPVTVVPNSSQGQAAGSSGAHCQFMLYGFDIPGRPYSLH